MSFSGLTLHNQLLHALEKAGHRHPGQVARAALESALSGRDVLAYARWGTGETIAFLLPALQNHIVAPGATVDAVILTVDLDRAVRIEQELRELGGADTPCCVLYGVAGLGALNQAAQQEYRIVVTTPDRLDAHLGRHYLQLDAMRLLVVEGTDEMERLDMLPVLRRMAEHLSPQRQTLVFAAAPTDEVRALAEVLLHEPVEVALPDDKAEPSDVPQEVWPVPAHLKTRLLVRLAEDLRLSQTVVLVDNPALPRTLVRKLRARDVRAAALLPDFPPDQKNALTQGFRSGNNRLLVTTADGLADVELERVQHVVCYDIPTSSEACLEHMRRMGHARFSWFMAPEDETAIGAIEYEIGRPLARETLADFEYGLPAPDARGKARPAPDEAPLQQWGDRNAPRRDPLKILLAEWKPEPLPAVWVASEAGELEPAGRSGKGRRKSGKRKPRRRRRRGRRRKSGGGSGSATEGKSRRRGTRDAGT